MDGKYCAFGADAGQGEYIYVPTRVSGGEMNCGKFLLPFLVGGGTDHLATA
jgi:hypothetical protein